MKSKINFIKQALIVMALMVVAISVFNMLPAASASVKPGINENPVAEDTGGATSLKDLVLTVIDYFLGFLGLLAVVMVIYGGVTYVSSAGNDEAVGKAKKIIMYALVGIVVILLSFVVVNAITDSAVNTGQ